MIECESNPLKESYYQQGPKRRSDEIGKGSEDEQKGPDDHKSFFRSS
jgi:hypothetical protein